MWKKDGDMGFSEKDSTTLIARGTRITGDINFVGSLEVEGEVEGNISLSDGGKEGEVRIAKGGSIKGVIRAPIVIVNGDIEGDVHSSNHVELAAQAKIDGNVYYSLIEMVKGAQLNGQLIYTKTEKEAKLVSVAVKVD